MRRPTKLINALANSYNVENISFWDVDILLEWIDCLEEVIKLELQQDVDELDL